METNNNNVRFSFKILMEDFNFLKKLSYNKIVAGELDYKITSGLVEGIEILRKNTPNIPKSNNAELRRYYGGRQKSHIQLHKTSVNVSNDIHEFILDYIYYKLEEDPFYTNFYFITDVMEILKNKYKNKLVDIPEVTPN